MAFDAVLSDTAEAFVSSLAPDDRRAFYVALDLLLEDPYPDARTKVVLPFPYRPGTYGFEHGNFWIAYAFLNPHVLAIATVYWSPNSPRYPFGPHLN